MYLSKIQCSSTFDYTRAAYFIFDYVVIGSHISVYDCERKCEISGTFPSFYDYGVSSAVDLRVKNDRVIDAYDYKTATDMEVTCNGKNVSLFDYKVGRYYEYQLS